MQPWAENFYTILFKGDNLPIAFMLFLVGFFLIWGLRQARRTDRLSAGLDEKEKREAIVSDLER